MTKNNAVGRHSCLSILFFVQEKKWQKNFPFVTSQTRIQFRRATHMFFRRLSFTPGFSQVSEWVINRETVLWKGLSSQYLTLRVRWSITSPQDGRSGSTFAKDTW